MTEPIPIFNFLIIGLTTLMSWLAFRNPVLEDKYIFEPRAILADKEYYRLVSSAFLHSGWGHLLLNMISLYFFAGPLENMFGARDFLMIYLGAIIGGDLLSLYVHRHHDYRAYGASGGVCGVIFAYLLLFPGASIQQFGLPAIPGWLYAIGFMVSSFIAMKADKGNIGHDAHLGGAIIGLLVAAALHPWYAQTNWKLFTIVLSAAILLLIYLWMNPLFLSMRAFTGPHLRRRTRWRSANIPSHKREALQIDAILEKINKTGMDSLSVVERELLLTASAKFQSRAESKKPESGLAI
jgi:membrane associated rhomboid family serine protease